MKRRLCVIIICLAMCVALSADKALAEEPTLKLPEALKSIEEEAFCGNTSLYRVILPGSFTRIEQKAFAYSSVKRINLPDSIEYIEDDAFLACDLEYIAAEGDYCIPWCTDHGLSIASGEPIDPDEGEEFAIP